MLQVPVWWLSGEFLTGSLGAVSIMSMRVRRTTVELTNSKEATVKTYCIRGPDDYEGMQVFCR